MTETGIHPSHHLSGERRDAVPIFSFDEAQSFGAKPKPPAEGPGTDAAILDNATIYAQPSAVPMTGQALRRKPEGVLAGYNSVRVLELA